MNGAVEDAAGVRGGGVAQVLHDEGAVLEHVDHVAHVDLAHLGHLLALLVGAGGAARGKNKREFI